MNALFHGKATNLLIRIRAKPNHIKQSISIVITIVIFSGILFVWWSSRDARSRELEVREKTVSPVDGVSAMFDGLVAGFKERMSNAPAFGEVSKQAATSTATDTFDISGVVIIDPSASSSRVVATSTAKTKLLTF